MFVNRSVELIRKPCTFISISLCVKKTPLGLLVEFLLKCRTGVTNEGIKAIFVNV